MMVAKLVKKRRRNTRLRFKIINRMRMMMKIAHRMRMKKARRAVVMIMMILMNFLKGKRRKSSGT